MIFVIINLDIMFFKKYKLATTLALNVWKYYYYY